MAVQCKGSGLSSFGQDYSWVSPWVLVSFSSCCFTSQGASTFSLGPLGLNDRDPLLCQSQHQGMVLLGLADRVPATGLLKFSGRVLLARFLQHGPASLGSGASQP